MSSYVRTVSGAARFEWTKKISIHVENNFTGVHQTERVHGNHCSTQQHARTARVEMITLLFPGLIQKLQRSMFSGCGGGGATSWRLWFRTHSMERY